MENSRIIVVLGIAMLLIVASGFVLGFVGYFMEITDTALQGVTCDLTGNTLASNCQELFGLSIYPFLALRELFIWFSYIAIFVAVMAILVAGYNAGTSPVSMGIMAMVDILFTYMTLHVSNVYLTLLENNVIRAALTDYSVYNNVMIYLPWFFFIVSIFAIFISIVNYQRTKVNGGSSIDTLNY